MKKLKSLSLLDTLIILQILLLVIITIAGIFSFSTEHIYEITNRYGDLVKIYGYGIYANDSLLMAPIFIGTDYAVLFAVIPMQIITLILNRQYRSTKTKLFTMSLIATVCYYATSIVFGVTYNSLHLVYIALFGISFFALIISMNDINSETLKNAYSDKFPSRGITIFFVISGIALFVAWLPDILSSLIYGTSLSLIEVYTTSVTYVVDMGILSPLMFICIYLLKKRNGFGIQLLSLSLTLCVIIGIILPTQSLFHALAGVELSLQIVMTKIASFVLLAVFALYFLINLFKRLPKN